MKLYIILSIIILIIILLILFFYKTVENFTDDMNSVKVSIPVPVQKIEEQPIKTQIKTLNNNIIKNGNFENGQNVENHINQSGYNKIIVKKNPGKTSYVLEQQDTKTLTYYEMEVKCDKNAKYNLYFWVSVDKSGIEELDMNKLVYIKVQNEDYSYNYPRLNYNIVQKIILSNDENDAWYLLKYDFDVGNNTNKKMFIYLNNSDKLQFKKYYFTDISLYKVLIDASNFIYNDNLICYVDGYNYQSNIPTWHDLSGNGNDLFWSNIPMSDLSKGSLSTTNQKIVGFQTNNISNDNFTILICLNKITESSMMESNENDKDKDVYLLSIPGNDRYAFEIEFKDKHLVIHNGNNKVTTENEIILFNKSLLGFIYSNGILHINLDGLEVMSYNIGKLYLSNDPFMINKNKNMNYNLYSILVYNKVVDKTELSEIREYFIQNKDKNFNTPDINRYHMNNTATYTLNESDNMFNGYNKRELKMEYFNNNIKDDSNYKEKCLDQCATLCDIFSEKGECMSNCKKVLLSCQRYCDDPANSKNVICMEDSVKCDGKINNKCPEVYKKDGNYIIYVQPNSKYANKYGYSGDRSYGNNKEKAKYTYNKNFPDCSTPKELLAGNGKLYEGNCPYIIDESNPCYISSCADVNWNVENYKDLKIDKNCKKSVSNYCQINYDIDSNCACWSPEQRNTEKCREYRRFFEDPNDYCSPSQFKIEEHPDFNKYIKRDNIPCWGCKL